VIYAPTPWNSPRQPAHNLADALALDHRVLYVDPPLSPLSPFRYGLRENTWARLRVVATRGVRHAGRVRVFSPLVLPPIEHRRTRALSAPLLRAQIRLAVKRSLKGTSPVVLGWRGLEELAGVAGESLRVGVLMDHPAAGATLLGRDPDQLEREATAICQSSDLICTTSRPMQELLAERGWPSELVPFGFPKDLAEAFDRSEEPPEYQALPRPLLGYTGGIDDRLDYELIVELADRFSKGSLVFVGPVSPRLSQMAQTALGSRANIHVLGPRSRSRLPAYIRHLDVALLPYEDSLWTQHQSPMKVWEYLYAGPPIVGVGSAELRSFPPPLVNYAERANQVPSLVEQSLAHPATGREKRRDFALANTWEDRAAQIEALVERRAPAPSACMARLGETAERGHARAVAP
jgi:teichuronic acid biosynthesis glycosyltransferase TuaH